MAGKQLTEEVKTNSDPRVLEFVRSDYCAVIDKSKVGVMTESAASAEKRELSPIQEEEVRRRYLVPKVLRPTNSGDWRPFKPSTGLSGYCQVD